MNCSPRLGVSGASRVRNWFVSKLWSHGAVQGASFAHLGPKSKTPNIYKTASSLRAYFCVFFLIFVHVFMFLNVFSLLLAKLPLLQAQPDGTDTAKSRPFTHVTTASQAGLQLVVATTTEHRTPSVFGLQRIDSSDPDGIRGRSRWHNDSWRVNGLCQVVDLRNCPQRIACRVS